MEGSDCCLKRSRARLGRLNNLKTNNTNSEKGGGGIVKVRRKEGGASPTDRCSARKAQNQQKSKCSNSQDGSGELVMVRWEKEGNEPTRVDTRLEMLITEGNKATGSGG